MNETTIYQLTKMIFNHDFESFKRIKNIYLNDNHAKHLIKKYHPDWIEKRLNIKELIKYGSVFCKVIEPKLLDQTLWMELFNECDNDIIKYQIYKPEQRFDFQTLDNEMLDVILLKLPEVNDLKKFFYNLDFANLNDKYYQDKTYLNIILNCVKELNNEQLSMVIKKISKELLNDNEIWLNHYKTFIDYYKKDIINLIDKSLLLIDNKVILHLLKSKVDIFTKFYDEILNQPELITYLFKHGNFTVISKIKDNDLIKIKPLILKEMRRQYKRKGEAENQYHWRMLL